MSRLLLTVALLGISGTVFAQDFIKIGDSHDTDFWGETGYEFREDFPSALDYIAPNGRVQVNSDSMSDDYVADVFAGVYGSFDALVVAESIQTLSVENYGEFENYVDGGGCLIVIGDHGDGEDEFLNAVFGYGMGAAGANDGVDTFEIQSGANGTAFEGGPSSLLATNATALFSNVPGTILYEGTNGVGAFSVAQGAGSVVSLAYDYCCTDEETTEQDILDWYEVLDRAFTECTGAAVPTSVPANSRTGLIAIAVLLGLFGLVMLRRRELHLRR